MWYYQNPCMKRGILVILLLLLVVGVALIVKLSAEGNYTLISGAPPYGVSEGSAPDLGSVSWIYRWKRPNIPARVALQVGHWKNDELPDELEKLRGNSGAVGGGYAEWEVNLAIAKLTAEILKQSGIDAEILPATVPSQYWADVFVAIHADGSEDPAKQGFKIASPWMDFTGRANDLVKILYDSYGKETGLTTDENITKNMRGYYAFSWWRYEHAIHPMTTAVIIETGFLSNYSDRNLLINSPDVVAMGIAKGIKEYLQSINLL
jgi:hypothetical protein